MSFINEDTSRVKCICYIAKKAGNASNHRVLVEAVETKIELIWIVVKRVLVHTKLENIPKFQNLDKKSNFRTIILPSGGHVFFVVACSKARTYITKLVNRDVKAPGFLFIANKPPKRTPNVWSESQKYICFDEKDKKAHRKLLKWVRSFIWLFACSLVIVKCSVLMLDIWVTAI